MFSGEDRCIVFSGEDRCIVFSGEDRCIVFSVAHVQFLHRMFAQRPRQPLGIEMVTGFFPQRLHK